MGLNYYYNNLLYHDEYIVSLSLICATIYCFCFTLWAVGLTSRRLVCAQTRPSARSTFNRVAFNTGLISIELTCNHLSATFLACLCTLNTDFPASLKQSSKTIKSHFSPITKHFVRRSTLYNVKLHDLRILMEYTSKQLNGCIISKIKSIKLPNR